MKYQIYNHKTSNSQEEIVKKQFINDLCEFLKGQNKNLNKVPILGHKELDLMGLYNEVQVRGGFEEVILFLNLTIFR